METKSIGFIGGGRITKIFLQAFQNKQVSFENISVFDPSEQATTQLKQQFPNIQVERSTAALAKLDLVVIAVHPPVVMESVTSIKNLPGDQTWILSLAPKITIGKLEEVLDRKKIVRMIPNASTFVNQGYNPVAFHPATDESDKADFFKLMAVLGDNFEVTEKKLEAYAIVSAMLPTYFWFQWEEMVSIATQIGLDEAEAKNTVGTTLKKAMSLFFDTEFSNEEVKDLIPVKPIGEHEDDIRTIYQTKLIALYNKIKS